MNDLELYDLLCQVQSSAVSDSARIKELRASVATLNTTVEELRKELQGEQELLAASRREYHVLRESQARGDGLIHESEEDISQHRQRNEALVLRALALFERDVDHSMSESISSINSMSESISSIKNHVAQFSRVRATTILPQTSRSMHDNEASDPQCHPQASLLQPPQGTPRNQEVVPHKQSSRTRFFFGPSMK